MTGTLVWALRWSFTCLLLGLLVAGFLAGYSRCTDCKGPKDRIFLGLIWSILSLVSLGQIPTKGEASQTLNLWPWALGIAGCLLAIRIAWWFALR